jgi:hypothetical protein
MSAQTDITRAERDLLWDGATLDLTFSSPIADPRRDVEAAKASRRHVEFLFDLLDELGWTENDERSTFVVTADRVALAAYARERRGEMTRWAITADDEDEAAGLAAQARVLEALAVRFEQSEAS